MKWKQNNILEVDTGTDPDNIDAERILKLIDGQTTQPFKLEIMYTSKTNNQANGIWSGDPDTGLSRLSAMDITSTLKTRLQERHILQHQRYNS